VAISLLAQIGLPVLVKGLAEGLSHIKNPVAKGAAAALSELGEAFGSGEISEEQMSELHRHMEAMEAIESKERQVSLSQVNESLRAEVASSDPYVRRMRPTFGYIIASTWGAQMFALAYIIVFETDQASLVIDAMEKLGTIWAVGLSVLGIYVYKRSEEKRGIVRKTLFDSDPLQYKSSEQSPAPQRSPYND